MVYAVRLLEKYNRDEASESCRWEGFVRRSCHFHQRRSRSQDGDKKTKKKGEKKEWYALLSVKSLFCEVSERALV